jgi:hypothetical protein
VIRRPRLSYTARATRDRWRVLWAAEAIVAEADARRFESVEERMAAIRKETR